MSANIPIEIQAEIIKRVLHVKSLIRFRSVSKQWKSLIDSLEFITHHTLNHTPSLNRLLVNYAVNSEYKYVSIDDDDSFPLHKFSHDDSPNLKLISYILMHDSSHGLVFLYGESVQLQKNLTVLWNPTIKKSVAVVFEYDPYIVGFGVCPKTGEPKIVAMLNPDEDYPDWEAEVFTLSSGTWREISMNLQKPFKRNTSQFNQVVINGVIHWLACDSATRFIVTFDLTTETFGEIDLPDNLTPGCLSIYKVNESLVLINQDECGMFFDVWGMSKKDCSKPLFAKFFAFMCAACDCVTIYETVGFRKNGQLIRECLQIPLATTLEVYEPYTGHRNDLGFDLTKSCFRVISYTDSLLLLNHSDSIIQESSSLDSVTQE